MEGKNKITKDILAQEARFILDNVLNAGQAPGEISFDHLRRLCEPSISLRIADYLSFLAEFGYVSHDHSGQRILILPDGERVVSGEKIAEIVLDIVKHFRPLLPRPRSQENVTLSPPTSASALKRRTGEHREAADGRYEKLKTLGSGGIGTVFLARQTSLNRSVALKEIRELFSFFTEPQRREIIKRFDEEIIKAATLCHPNIAIIFDSNTHIEHPYYVSEYLKGGNLRQLLKYAEAISPDLTIKIFMQILHGLGHAHQQGVIHRGLKPENILFDNTGNVRITDFGLSRVVERDQVVIQHVYVGMGSVAYIAPELFIEPTEISPQSDLYALGIMLYEMLSRKIPGRRSPMPTQLHPALPKIIDDIFDRLTQDELSARYASVNELLEELYRSDAMAQFSGIREVIFFIDNPLAQLKITTPTEEPVEEQIISPHVSPDAPLSADPSMPPLSLDPSTSSENPTTNANEQQVDSDLADLATPAPEIISPSSPAPPADMSIDIQNSSHPIFNVPTAPGANNPLPMESIDEDTFIHDAEDELNEDRPRRRSRIERPYSFQQRIKDRDK